MKLFDQKPRISNDTGHIGILEKGSRKLHISDRSFGTGGDAGKALRSAFLEPLTVHRLRDLTCSPSPGPDEPQGIGDLIEPLHRYGSQRIDRFSPSPAINID